MNLEASKENHEINFLKNEIEQFAKKLAELKSSEEPIAEIDKKMLFDFGQQMVKYLDGVIVDREQETYLPEFNDEEFEITWNNRVELRNVEVDVTEVVDKIKVGIII
jgi:cell shape-determining protein MreC